MLVLSRRAGESIAIGDQITIQVLGIKGNHTRIGITAPIEMAIHRKELIRTTKNEKYCKNSVMSNAAKKHKNQ